MSFAAWERSAGRGMGMVDRKSRAAGAAYRVDAGAVAEAMLRHPGVRRLLGAPPVTPAGGARSRATALPPSRTA